MNVRSWTEAEDEMVRIAASKTDPSITYSVIARRLGMNGGQVRLRALKLRVGYVVPSDVDARSVWRPGCTKTQARSLVSRSLKKYRLVRPSHCADCGGAGTPAKDGRSSIQAHHHQGYEYPLDVHWVCTKCHRKLDPVPSGQDCVTAKLTNQQVAAIRRDAESSVMLRKIMAEHKISKSQLYRILTNQSWRQAGKGYVARPKKPTNGERDAEIVRRYLAGEAISAIGRDFGICFQRVFQIAQAAGVHRPRLSPPANRGTSLEGEPWPMEGRNRG